jgi:8-oxo-dGTP diphosphatase
MESAPSKRRDLRASTSGVKANSLKPAVSVAVIDDARRLLLVRRSDSGFWAMPGGTMELNESVETCAHREVLEETGAVIRVTGIVGVYSDPDTLIAYSDGEVRREFSILLAASSETRTLAHDAESTDVQWVALDQLDDYPMVESQLRRIADVIEYINSGAFSLR